MEIKTKFDCGQHVWLMFENKPLEMVVVEVYPCNYKLAENGEVHNVRNHAYGIQPLNRVENKTYPYMVIETILFATKKELLMSLL